ncbi:MAG: TolC family protein [Prevotella sp.]
MTEYVSAKTWTLQECLDYASHNNISLKKASITRLSAHEDMLESKSALLPSLDASTSQSLILRPFPEEGGATVANGYVQSSVDKLYYNGSYGINLNWTVWDGKRTRNQIRLNTLSEQQAVADSATLANSIHEQIAMLYYQILYSTEAVEVTRQALELSKVNENRGKVMVEVGKMSRADLAQLTAQRAQDEYNVVAAESNVRNFKRQLKELLEITDNEPFDIETADGSDRDALAEIPSMLSVYNSALSTRPEIRAQKIAIESGDVSLDIAKAQKMPTVGFVSSLSTNTTTMSNDGWGSQLKTNMSMAAGFTVSIPLLDNRKAKTAVNKAVLSRMSNELELKNLETQLSSNIENYWIQAVDYQSKYKAAKVNTQSQQESYDLLSEQFSLGLKNIVELMTGKNNLLSAKQNELESKYMAILNIQMLNFYANGKM